LSSCATDARTPVAPAPSGPPYVRPEVVARHAEQFDDELAERPAGSQQELAAATYILGHLQKAGYVARLDSVPVRDLVRSTNVVALPPRGDTPEVVVTVAYDSGSSRGRAGADIGLFLELARAFNASGSRASVEFVALGAENTGINGGHLGSRRLARLLLDDDLDPVVISISGAGRSRLCARGAAGDVLTDAFRDRLADCESDVAAGDPFAAAGFRHVAVAGPVPALGEALLEVLSS
jgi:hypothetical protein